jgi:NifU-like protein involved in Fe-S cluster formation
VSAARLYTPELLGLAVELARHPALTQAAVRGEARSATCGSTLAMDLELDEAGRIQQLGLRVQACAVGQAAAAIFARHAAGRNAGDIGATLRGLEAWLAGEGELPDWPDLALIDAARDYPGRHGAILLPWRAALAALSSEAPAS